MPVLVAVHPGAVIPAARVEMRVLVSRTRHRRLPGRVKMFVRYLSVR
jgi:hypothetical protein